MFRWARELRGRTIDDVAKHFKKTSSQINDWETGKKTPTLNQAQSLADFYNRHLLEFYLNIPPIIPTPKSIPDFRTYAKTPSLSENWEIQHEWKWAEAQRLNALDLFEELREEPPEIPGELFSSLKMNPEGVADAFRAHLNFSIQEQVTLSNNIALPQLIRKKLESAGILTIKQSHLTQIGVRGMCIALLPLPVIVFGKESPAAQAFTIAHELGHILIKESGISGHMKRNVDNDIERWCNRFSAAFLMPRIQVLNLAGAPPVIPAPSIDNEALAKLAKSFCVSSHAMLIRLIDLGYVLDSYYWDIKKPEFDAIEQDYRSFGRAKYYGSRYKSSLGDLYTGLVIDAWTSGKITNHNAAEYMGIKNLTHLNAIRDALTSQ